MSEDDLRSMLLARLTARYGDLMKTKEVAEAMRLHTNSVRVISEDALPKGGGMGRRGLVYMTVDVVAYMVRHCRHAARQETAATDNLMAA